MAGSKAGGVKLRNTMIKRYGSEEAWKKAFKEISRKGGKAPTKVPRGFAADRSRARWAGQKGGQSKAARSPHALGFYTYYERNRNELNNTKAEDFIGMVKLSATQEELATFIGRTVYLVRELQKALEKENI